MLSRTAFYSGEGVLVSAVGICADSEPILNFLECSAVDGRQILRVAEIRQGIRRWESQVCDPYDKSQAVRDTVKQLRDVIDCALVVKHKGEKFDSCKPAVT